MKLKQTGSNMTELQTSSGNVPQSAIDDLLAAGQ